MNQPNYIIMQSYGNEGVFLECAFALLSLSRLYKTEELSNTEIWIYTDNPGWFKALNSTLPLHYKVMDEQTIRQWRGQIDFVHRVKIEVLLDFTKDHTGNILYTDTDVVFTHSMDKMWQNIEGGALYMHIMEGRVSDKSNPLLKKLDAYLRTSKAQQASGKPLYDMDMWNAGVIGFNTTKKELLTEILKYTDSEFPKFPKHIVEQFAFSVKFQQAGNVWSAVPYTLHYWNMKELRTVFASFFNHFKGCPWADLARYSSLLQLYVLVLEKIRFEYNRSFTEKLGNKQWQPGNYDWDALAKQV